MKKEKKDYTISLRVNEKTMKKIEELIDHYQYELYEKGIDYSNINQSLIINFAIDKLHYDIIK